jgi:ABC-type glycerol-3-phosphate transport system substrate-binding protein
MNKLKKRALAAVAVAALAGCAGAPVASLSGSGDAPVQVAQRKVTRVLPSYSSLGGYRYRRLVAVAVTD